VRVEPVAAEVPAAVVGAAEDAKQLGEAHPAGVGHPVFAVTGKRHVLRFQGASRADLGGLLAEERNPDTELPLPLHGVALAVAAADQDHVTVRSEEHTSELQSRENLVCRLLLEKKNTINR